MVWEVTVDWWTVVPTAVGTGVGVVAGGLITAYFSWRGSKELRREAEKQRQVTLKVIQILDGTGLIEIKEWDPDTGEPIRWPVTSSRTIRWNVEAQDQPQEPEQEEAGVQDRGEPARRSIWRRWFGD